MAETPTTRSLQRTAFAVLKQFGFYQPAIQVWRTPEPVGGLTPDPVQIGTVPGGIIPATAAAALVLPLADDLGGARGDFISYTGGTIVLQNGDQLRLVDGSGTAIYPVEGVSQWNAVQIGNLSEVQRG